MRQIIRAWTWRSGCLLIPSATKETLAPLLCNPIWVLDALVTRAILARHLRVIMTTFDASDAGLKRPFYPLPEVTFLIINWKQEVLYGVAAIIQQSTIGSHWLKDLNVSTLIILVHGERIDFPYQYYLVVRSPKFS